MVGVVLRLLRANTTCQALLGYYHYPILKIRKLSQGEIAYSVTILAHLRKMLVPPPFCFACWRLKVFSIVFFQWQAKDGFKTA